MADSNNKPKVSNARDTVETLVEMSKMLDTGLDEETLALCIRLCESGVNPDALAQAILEMRKEVASVTPSVCVAESFEPPT